MNIKAFIEDSKKKAITHAPPIIISIVIIIITFIIAHIVKKNIANLSKDVDFKPNNDKILYDLLSNIAYYTLIIIGILIALVNVGFNLSSLLVVFGSIGLAIALSIQSTIAQAVSGMVIVSFKYFNLDDLIEVNGVQGYVNKFNLLNTVIRLPTGEKVVMPNSIITTTSFKNYFEKDEIYIDTFITVSNNNKINYESLIEHLKAEIYTKSQYVIKNKDSVKVNISDISLSGTKLFVRILINSRDYYLAYNQARKIIRTLLEEENIVLLDNYYINNQSNNYRGNNYS